MATKMGQMIGLMFLVCVSFGGAWAQESKRFEPEIPPGFRPENDVAESGLWMIVDRHAEQLDYSKFILRQPDINAYIKSIACRLAPAYCAAIKIYIVRTPYFNATMRPNGVMEIWSGLLLRVQNEAQLAAVIGHELAHYLLRHSIKNWQARRNTSNIMAFLSLGLAVAAGAEAANTANLLALAAMFQYGRNQETEADLYGLQMMTDAGYHPMAASDVWAFLNEERRFGCVSDYVSQQQKKSKKWDNRKALSIEKKATKRCRKAGRSLNDILFASHPSSEARMHLLRAEATGVSAELNYHNARFDSHLANYLQLFAADQLQQHNFGRTEFILNHLDENPNLSAQVLFFKGELHRMRSATGDLAKAIDFYQQATLFDNAPPEAYRGLGFMQMKAGDRDAAKAAFEKYLALVPDAQDKSMIEFYVR